MGLDQGFVSENFGKACWLIYPLSIWKNYLYYPKKKNLRFALNGFANFNTYSHCLNIYPWKWKHNVFKNNEIVICIILKLRITIMILSLTAQTGKGK